MKLEKLQAYITPETMAALKKLAVIERRSESSMAAILLEECLESKRQEWREKQALPSISKSRRPRDTRRKKAEWQDVEDMPFSPNEAK